MLFTSTANCFCEGKRELKRISPDVKIDTEQIRAVLEDEVLKREVVEGDKAQEASKRIARAASKALRSKGETTTAGENTEILIKKPEPEIHLPAPTANSIAPQAPPAP